MSPHEPFAVIPLSADVAQRAARVQKWIDALPKFKPVTKTTTQEIAEAIAAAFVTCKAVATCVRGENRKERRARQARAR